MRANLRANILIHRHLRANSSNSTKSTGNWHLADKIPQTSILLPPQALAGKHPDDSSNSTSLHRHLRANILIHRHLQANILIHRHLQANILMTVPTQPSQQALAGKHPDPQALASKHPDGSSNSTKSTGNWHLAGKIPQTSYSLHMPTSACGLNLPPQALAGKHPDPQVLVGKHPDDSSNSTSLHRHLRANILIHRHLRANILMAVPTQPSQQATGI